MGSKGLELGVAMTGFVALIMRVRGYSERSGGEDTYTCSDDICNVGRVGSYRRLLSVDDLAWR